MGIGIVRWWRRVRIARRARRRMRKSIRADIRRVRREIDRLEDQRDAEGALARAERRVIEAEPLLPDALWEFRRDALQSELEALRKRYREL